LVDARDRTGAGQGLALVNIVVKAAHGELRLCTHGVHQRYSHRITAPCTHPIAGTTVTVLLPVAHGAARSPLNPTDLRHPSPTPDSPATISDRTSRTGSTFEPAEVKVDRRSMRTYRYVRRSGHPLANGFREINQTRF
jgi:hypothetical protein